MRVLVPILAIIVAVAFALAMAFSGDAPPIPKDDPTTPSAETRNADDPGPEQPGESPTAAQPDADGQTPPAAVDAAAIKPEEPAEPVDVEPIAGLHALGAEHAPAVSLGSTDPESAFKIHVDFTSYGAGVQRIELADYAQFVDPPNEGDSKLPYTLVDAHFGLGPDASPAFYPYAARRLRVNEGEWIDLSGFTAPHPRWKTDPVVQTDDKQSVTYRMPIADESGEVLLELTRTWTVSAESYDLSLDQNVINKTGEPLKVQFEQYGQGDVLTDLGAYLGDRRMFITGYFRDQTPPKFEILVEDGFVQRTKLIKKKRALWPNPKLPEKKNPRLAWIASENRYFALITHTSIPADATETADVPEFDTVFPGIGFEVLDQPGVVVQHADEEHIAITMLTQELTLPAEGSLGLDFAVYAGPRQKDLLEAAPYDLLDFDKLIRYELGCTFCTFQWLAKGLLGYLKWLHWAVSDWGVSIIILVLTVRLILHPITKRAQGNMMKMSKQMGALQPDVKKLKDKYKDDPTALNREMMKLYREKGINPANMLGCLPMLLQTPIWIALYAMLYFAIELRHEPAFYGLFQAISGGSWHFLQDLSVSDNFIRFIPPDQPAYKITWLPLIQPEFRSLNILPLAMAIVFYFQMKLTSPPPQNDQQKQQQAIMKVMPFIFPVMLYSAPAGLTLYICCSTLAGIVDSYLVRKHIREQEEAGTLFDKKPVKPGGFRDKLSKRFEMAQQLASEKQKEMQKRQQSGGGGGKGKKKRK